MIFDHKTLIVLDSNIIISDFWMRGQSFEYLRTHMFVGHTLVIPEIVIEEVVNHFFTRATEVLEKVRLNETPKTLARFHSLFGKNSSPAHSNVKLLTKQYRDFLYKVIEENDGFIAKTPEVSQSILITRSIQRKKPFSSSDKGYRDTLIWYTILALIDTKTMLSFVTNNTHDFFGEDGHIHYELLAEASAKLGSVEHIKFHKSLDEVIAYFDEDGESSSSAFRRALITSGYQGFDIWAWINENLIDFLPQDGLEDVNWAGFSAGAENPILVDIEEIVALDIPRAKKISEGIVRFSCDFSIIGHFNCEILLNSWQGIVSSQQLVDFNERDGDKNWWNEITIRAVGTFFMLMDFDLRKRNPVKVEFQSLEHWSEYPEALFFDELDEI